MHKHDFSWLHHKGPQALFECFKGKAEIRFVGGCVRNTLLGIRLQDDFDLAIDCAPEDTMRHLRTAGITTIPTGLKHGTVSAVIDGMSYEITTLRQDKEHDGRHAVVEFTHNWEEDAKRRDFTINALYVNEEGKIFDVVGGFSDIAQGRVRFIGDADARIQEDYLRILRFFRIHAYYGQGALDPCGLAACTRWHHALSTLSKERITKEFFKLLDAANPWPVIDAMQHAKILQEIVPSSIRSLPFQTLEQHTGYRPSAYVRWASLTSEKGDRLCLSRNQNSTFHALQSLLAFEGLPHSLYAEKKDIVLGRGWIHCLHVATQDLPLATKMWSAYKVHIERFQPKHFPLDGTALLAAGVQGAEIGRRLACTKRWWIDTGESAEAQACLDYALQLD
jgi:poly(A) polymerase